MALCRWSTNLHRYCWNIARLAIFTSLILTVLKWNNRIFGCHATAVCAVNWLRIVEFDVRCRLYTVHFYFGCASCSQLKFHGSILDVLLSQWLHTCMVVNIYSLYCMTERCKSFCMVFGCLTFTECYSDVNYIFTMWMQGLFKLGEFGDNCQRIWELIVLISDEFHCSTALKIKKQRFQTVYRGFIPSHLALAFCSPFVEACVVFEAVSWMQQKNLQARGWGQPLHSRVCPVSTTTRHKQMGYRCPSWSHSVATYNCAKSRTGKIKCITL